MHIVSKVKTKQQTTLAQWETRGFRGKLLGYSINPSHRSKFIELHNLKLLVIVYFTFMHIKIKINEQMAQNIFKYCLD